MNDEYNYRYLERIGLLCGLEAPTVDQQAVANHEAWEAVRRLWPLTTMLQA